MTSAERKRLMNWLDSIPKPDIKLHEYVRQAWPQLNPMIPYIDGWHIGLVCEHLEAVSWGDIQNLIINIPPRCMKSNLISVMWMTWEWTWLPGLSWLFTSHAGPLSTRDSVACRNLIESDWYQSNWGGVYQLAGDQNQKTRFANDQGGERIARGRRAIGEGGQRLVCDDIMTWEEAESETIRPGVLAFVENFFTTRASSTDTARVVIEQRLHTNDATGFLLKKMEEGGLQWEHVVLPMEFEPSRYVSGVDLDDPRTTTKQPLWPKRFSSADMASFKADSYKWAGQYQQRPAPAGGGIWKEKWFKFWYPAHAEAPEPWRVRLADGTWFACEQKPLPEKSKLDDWMQSWDFAFKDKRTSSFVVGQVWAREMADRYLMDQERGHYDLVATIKAVLRVSQTWPQTRRKLYEDKANGPSVKSALKKRLTGLVPVQTKSDSKVARARGVSADIEGGNVWLPHPHFAPWVKEFLIECVLFPNATNDDQVDSTSQALADYAERDLQTGGTAMNLRYDDPYEQGVSDEDDPYADEDDDLFDSMWYED